MIKWSSALTIFVAICFLTTSVSANVLTQDLPHPDVANNLYQVQTTNSSSYVEPTNTCTDGNPTFYFITMDPSKSSQTSVEYKGQMISVTTIVTENLLEINSSCIPNTTFFFDDGVYNDNSGYAQFMRDNLALVGLNKTASGESSVTFKRALEPGQSYVFRRVFNNPGIYLENIIFDGGGHNLATNNEGRSKGDFALFVTENCSDFVMKDVIIQNVGKDVGSYSRRNVAMQIMYGQGQKNFENITVRNVKTGPYGIIFTNRAINNYFKNITIDASAASAFSHGFRVEDNRSIGRYTESSAVFSGNVNMSTNYVYIQDYRYKTIVFPDDYRYIQYSNSAGSDSGSAYRVYNKFPPYNGTFYGVLDRTDNYWVVRETNDQSVSVSSQLAAIRNIRRTMNNVTNPSVNNAGINALDPARIPPVNIRLVIEDGSINSFDVPDFGDGVPVNIVAVSDLDKPYTSSALIEVEADQTFNLGPNGANVRLCNFDFHSKAFNTLHEAVSGRDSSAPVTDVLDTHYPSGLNYADYADTTETPFVINSSSDTFVNCKFTELAQTIDLTVNHPVIRVGETASAAAVVSASYTNSTDPVFLSRTGAEDSSIYYSSSDESIAAVDPDSGLITAVSEGSVTIYAKAKDTYNQGEIEKPYASYEMTIRSGSYIITASSGV